jgi:5-methylcytosine-specific restriction endonuclease McrA
MTNVIVLNGDYSFLNTISWQKALKLLVKGKATVVKYADKAVRTAEGIVMKLPAVMKLIKIVRTIYRTHIPFSKKNVLIRDNYTCQYCGTSNELTIDHVVPVSRGGKSIFENCVAACRECNGKKGNRLPKECNMFIKKSPVAPTISEFTRLKAMKVGIFDLLKELGVY